jgi:Uma2 family endonuclease
MSAVMTDWINRHRITVDDYYRMFEVGILSEDARVELIEGEIIDMGKMGTNHAGLITQLTRLLINSVVDHANLLPQLPLRLSDISEPVPDLALLRPRADFYKKQQPRPEDTLLIIEISDSSLRYDLQIKASLYARNGIPEYWIIDVQGQQIRFFRSPVSGQYTDVASMDAPGSVSPVALPQIRVDLTHLFDE